MRFRRTKLFLLSTILCVPSGCIAALSQQPKATEAQPISILESDNKKLQDENAGLRIQLSTLKMQMLQQSASAVMSERQQSIDQLVSSHPGMTWDEKQQMLVPKPPPTPNRGTTPSRGNNTKAGTPGALPVVPVPATIPSASAPPAPKQ